MPPLKVAGLGKRYGKRQLFSGLALELDRGEALVVRGANGAGKSTLLRVLAGLVPPSEGTVARPSRVGYAALDLALYAHLTAAEHLRLGADLRDVPMPADGLARVGLGAQADRRGAELSTGQRMRLKLALAELGEPELLLLDEPGASLDEPGRELVQAVIARGRGRGAVVIATNDPREGRDATQELALG